jgi:chromosome segregation ATPase
MEKSTAELLIDFYRDYLQPEFVAIREKQTEHDEKFLEVLDHFDSLYKQVGRLEDEYLMLVHGLKRIEDSLEGKIVKRSDLDKRLKEIKEQFSQLQTRLESVERQLARA